MRVLQDISTQIESYSYIETLSEGELIDRAQRILAAGSAFSILSGRYFRALKARYPGRFMDTIERDFDGISIDRIEAWMFIEQAFPDPATWANLPPAWTTQLVLARIPEKQRFQWLKDGTIHRGLSGALARDLLRKALPTPAPASDSGRDDDGDHGGDGDHGREDGNHGDADGQQEDQVGVDFIEPGRGAGIIDLSWKDTHAGRNAEVEGLKAHNEELQAYVERLESEAKNSDREKEDLKGRNAELEATIGFDVGWNQRCALKNAMETVEEALTNKADSGERHRLVKLAGDYIVDLVLSARHANLSIERFDLAYRPNVEERFTPKGKEDESFVPTGTEAHSQEQVSV